MAMASTSIRPIPSVAVTFVSAAKPEVVCTAAAARLLLPFFVDGGDSVAIARQASHSRVHVFAHTDGDSGDRNSGARSHIRPHDDISGQPR